MSIRSTRALTPLALALTFALAACSSGESSSIEALAAGSLAQLDGSLDVPGLQAPVEIIRDELRKCGATDEQVTHFEEEGDSFDAALEWAREGDLVVILDLGRVSNIQDKLEALSAQ